MRVSPGQKIGVIAGWGRLPLVVAESLRARGALVYGLAVRGHADPAFAGLCHEYREVGLARLGEAIRYYRRHDVKLGTLAGKIFKVRLFDRWLWWKNLPDWRCLKEFYSHFFSLSKDRRDDSLLMTIVNAFASDGITLAAATDLVPELLVKFGLLAGRLSFAQRKDVEFGWRMAKALGQLDIGQSVCVAGQAVLAAEALEGTDECIRRAGTLCKAGGFTVVKVAKPQQDMRFDVPTIGLGTLKTMAAAGAKVLAVEAEKTILLDEPAVIAAAQRLGLTLVAVQPDRFDLLSDESAAQS